MELPEITLRQQAVWYLWGLRRVRIKEIAQLFGVTPRTICRELAVLRARGWRRASVKEAPAHMGLDLFLRARGHIDAAFRLGCEELALQGTHSRGGEIFAGLLQMAQLEANLVLAVSQLVRSTEQAQSSQHSPAVDIWMEIMKEELAAALATMLHR